MVEESMMKHNVESDKEEQPTGTRNSERESLDVEEKTELLAKQKKSYPTHHKQTPSGKWKEAPQEEQEKATRPRIHSRRSWTS